MLDPPAWDSMILLTISIVEPLTAFATAASNSPCVDTADVSGVGMIVVGTIVGAVLGTGVGIKLGTGEGFKLGTGVGINVGNGVGWYVGNGARLGASVGVGTWSFLNE